MAYTIFSTIAILIIWGLTTLYKKVDTNVDEYKLKRNPNDTPTLEKQLMKSFRANEKDSALIITNKILEYDTKNILANMIRSVYYFEEKDFKNADKCLRWTVTEIFPMNDLQKLCSKWSSVTSSDNLTAFALITSKTYYYYGYVCHVQERYDDAKTYKAKSKKFSLQPARLKLY